MVEIKRKSSEVIYNTDYDSISGTRIDDQDLSEADFSHMDLRRTTFVKVNFSNADFSHCDLSNSHFYKCDLTGADLSHANLYYVRLEECNLTEANLSYANLEGTTFWISLLKQTNLCCVRIMNTEFLNDQVVCAGGLDDIRSEMLVYNVTEDEVWDEDYTIGVPLEEYIPLKKEEVYDRSDEEDQEENWEPYHHALAFFSALRQSHLKRVAD